MTTGNVSTLHRVVPNAGSSEFVTVQVAGQLLGLPIERVHDVFAVHEMTRVPLASKEVAGLLNLRGRVVTALSLRSRLGLPEAESSGRRMAVGLEQKGEAYGLLVDEVGEVLSISFDSLQPNPVHLDPRWASVSRGVLQLKGRLLVILDVDTVLSFDVKGAAA